MIRETNSGDDYYIEINPRFGGGAPLSIMAGADSAEALLRLIRGEKLVFRDRAAEDGSIFSRFDQSVRIS
jgi:carbamoyl-phosphate synthase large subunit